MLVLVTLPRVLSVLRFIGESDEDNVIKLEDIVVVFVRTVSKFRLGDSILPVVVVVANSPTCSFPLVTGPVVIFSICVSERGKQR